MEATHYVVIAILLWAAYYAGVRQERRRQRKTGVCQCDHRECYHGMSGNCWITNCDCRKYIETVVEIKKEDTEDEELKKLREMAGL